MKKDIVYGDIYKTLNAGQTNTFDCFIAGENIFITGDAGTGKSYLVKAIDEFCTLNDLTIVKTAPTGVAALNIYGATLHKQFKLEVGLDFSEVTENSVVTNKAYNFLKRTDILLIDEISMVRMDIFDRLMQIIFYYNEYRAKKKKKPIQIIFVGDFGQLAPVINKEERPHLEEHYGKPIGDGYCFQSKYWRMFKVHTCRLTEVVRQQDPEFCAALDECKEGDSHCLQFFRAKSASEEIPDAIWLCGVNATAKRKNDEGLARINKPLLQYKAVYDGDATIKDKLADDEFFVKVGARVVMLVNDASGAYQNGSMGTVLNVMNEFIYIKIDDKKKADGTIETAGKVVMIEPHEFCKYKYESKNVETPIFDENNAPIIDEETGLQKVKREIKLCKVQTGSVTQYPMRLGYAVTIHKSQGQTYDAMNLEPEIWDCGQLYVAMSRCKTIERVYIHGALTQRMVKASDEVLSFTNNPEGYSFFGDGMVTMFVPEKYKERIEALIAEWDGLPLPEAKPEAETKEDKKPVSVKQNAPAKRVWGKPQTQEQTAKIVAMEAEKERRQYEEKLRQSYKDVPDFVSGVQLELFASGGEY